MAVAEVSTGPEVLPFLQKPGAGYVQTFVRFGPDMPDDVIMTLDQEGSAVLFMFQAAIGWPF
jgi:hypothetical protein